MEARRLALQYEIDETAAAESSAHGTDSPERLLSSTGPSPSHLALSLVAQALESIRVDLQDGVTLNGERCREQARSESTKPGTKHDGAKK